MVLLVINYWICLHETIIAHHSAVVVVVAAFFPVNNIAKRSTVLRSNRSGYTKQILSAVKTAARKLSIARMDAVLAMDARRPELAARLLSPQIMA